MSTKVLLYLVLGVFIFSLPVFAQVALKTGSIYGKVIDDKGAPLPGVSVTLQSEMVPTQTASSGENGGFRFANLPPGMYSVNFSIEGFTQVTQEEVSVNTGREVQLQITLKPSLSEEFTVIGETPVVDTKKTGTSDSFNRDYLEDVPSSRDPWTIIDQTAGVDNDRYNVAGSESGQQTLFIARGGSDQNTVWNYDGVNATDPASIGGSPTYYDFDAFEELQISTGGNDVSIQTGGVAVNIVTKRGGNKWEANASYFYSGDSLQGDNTPDELAAIGAKSNRLDEVKDYGFDIGGPIVRDKLFAWGAYRKNEIGLITVANLPDFTELQDFNFKANMNWNSSNESQFGYFKGEKTKHGRPAISAAIQAPETLWEQGGTDTILPGIWTGQHTWIPNDHTILTGRYGYLGTPGFTLSPVGGFNVPVIYLQSVPRYESTMYGLDPIDRPAHDINVDLNYFREKIAGGDHEFKFGFEYKTADIHSNLSYGNGIWIGDYLQTVPRGPLTSGYLQLYHAQDKRFEMNRISWYANDTFRRDRLTLNLGLRMDNQKANNKASTSPAIPGFESFVGPLEFTGNEGPSFTNFSPRLGVTYDLSGNGKTIVRGNYAHYADAYNPTYVTNINPTATSNGAFFNYTNLNGDREITLDEITAGPFYYGGLNGPVFDVNAFLASRKIADDFHNSGADEIIAGFERQVATDFSVGVTYTYRSYFDPTVIIPFGLTQNDYTQVGTFTLNTVLGNFNVPTYSATLYDDQGISILQNIDDYKTSYNGVDITARKRMSDNFMINGSVTLQRQKANYDGGDSNGFYLGDAGLSGSVFPFDPTNLTFLDDQPYAVGPTSSGKSGVYPFSEWSLKVSGIYNFPWDVSVGAFARYQQGYPYVLFGSFSDTTLQSAFGTTTHRIMVEPFGSRRYDNIFTLDLQFEKAFEIGDYGRIGFSANLFNVTNSNTVIRRNRSVASSTLNAIDELISARALRLGVRYSF